MRAALAALALTVAAAAPAAGGDARPVAYAVRDAIAIDAPLTDAPADPVRGAALFARHCAACHADAAGLATPDAAALRLAVVNLAIARPAAPDHAFYDLPPVDPDAGAMPQTRLTALEIEDILAFVTTPSQGAGPDAGPDTGPDTGSDTGPDAGPDAGPDRAREGDRP